VGGLLAASRDGDFKALSDSGLQKDFADHLAGIEQLMRTSGVGER
jgi:hypothetical protein